MDGTQDIQGIGLESICIRYVTDTFDVRGDFIGLYNISSTTGQSISRAHFDALIRLQLPIEQYEFRLTMELVLSRKYNGCQAAVKKVQPIDKYIHCGAHIILHLTSKAVPTTPVHQGCS